MAAPVPHDADELARLAGVIASFDPSRSSSTAVRALFAIRWRLGALLGWDRAGSGVGGRVVALRDRLPGDLRQLPGPEFDALPFASVYLTENEWAAETANETMHGVLHIGVVADPAGGRRGQMAVLVKPNGRLGKAYMAAIRPFRHLVVYPRLIEEIERGSAGAVRQIPVPPQARAHSTLSHIDYEDAFVVENRAALERSPEQWMRTILEDAPAAVRSQLVSGWTSIGLKLGRDGVLGWQVHRSTPEFVLLGADSRIGMPGELLLERRGDALLFATFVQHENAVARAVWAGVEPVHVPVVRRVLEGSRARWA